MLATVVGVALAGSAANANKIVTPLAILDVIDGFVGCGLIRRMLGVWVWIWIYGLRHPGTRVIAGATHRLGWFLGYKPVSPNNA